MIITCEVSEATVGASASINGCGTFGQPGVSVGPWGPLGSLEAPESDAVAFVVSCRGAGLRCLSTVARVVPVARVTVEGVLAELMLWFEACGFGVTWVAPCFPVCF